MKKYSKLTIFALIIVMLFTVGAVAANENVTNELSSIDQTSHIGTVSYVEPVQQEETPSIEATASDDIQDVTGEVTSETQETQKNEYVSSSDNTITSNSKDKTQKNSEPILKASNDEDVLGRTIYLSSDYFYSLRDAISEAQEGDVIDLMGHTISGSYPTVDTRPKNKMPITIINGTIDGAFVPQNDVSYYEFCHIENVTFMNYKIDHYRGLFFTGSYLKNVHFENFVFFRDGMCSHGSTFDNVTFNNMIGTRVGPQGNYEYGVTVVAYDHTKFYNCSFTDCHTKQHSGAICVAGVPGNIVDIIDCKFYNCTSGVAGAVYVHGTDTTPNHHSNIKNCEFINCHAKEWGGAIGSSQDYLNVENCIFINNTAKQGAAFMVGGITYGLDGNNSQGHYNIMKNCYFYNNTGSEEGGAVHITGNHNSAVGCIFDDNIAENGKGAAIYVEGRNASVISSKFTNHVSDMGTVYIEGRDAYIFKSNFTDNHANYGGAGVYIEGSDAQVIESHFINNNATHGGAGVFIHGDNSLVNHSTFKGNDAYQHGGAIHTIGSHARILNSEFYDNHAIPLIRDDPDYGLGGAVYIDGNNNEVRFSTFIGNTAKNGSAIYTNGYNFHVEDDRFVENQAWSYFLFTEAHPPVSYWSEDLVEVINVTLIAGDNIINAIYNNASNKQIFFHNVTYELSDFSLFNSSSRTTTDEEINPVPGVQFSNGGRILYQDPREDNQRISLNITYKGNQVFFDDNLTTNLYGNVLLPLTKENMSDRQYHPGVYTVYASHPEDALYTAIENSTTFTILPHVDVSVTKTSNKDVYFVGENAIFTITVTGVGTNATNVKVRDILPSSLEFVSASATQGTYDSVNNIWDIGFLPHLAVQRLTLTVKTTELGAFDNVVNVTCDEKDWNLSNNVDNKTIHVDLYYTKEANVTQTSAGEYIEYYLRVYNTGDTTYTETVRVRDVMQEGIQYTGEYDLVGAELTGVRYINYVFEQIWEITNIAPNSRARINVKAKALKDGLWNNTMQVWHYPPVNATVNVSSVADLHIFKDVQPSKVNKGDIVQWTIAVVNHGPSKAMNVYVSDILPAGLDIVNHAITTKGVYTRTTGIWNIGELGLEEWAYLYVNTTVLLSNANITNVAVVNSSTPDSNLTNNIANDTVETNPEGDVGIEKTVSTHDSNHNDVISWTIVVTNHGPDKATGIKVTDILPNGLRIINTTESQGKVYNRATGVWDVGDLENGASATLVIWTRVTTYNTIINNVANVTSTSTDTNPSNNRDEDFTQVGPEADLVLVKFANKHELIKGDTVIWTITVTNNGPNDAEDVKVTDILPYGVKFITSSSTRYDNNTGIWDIGDLENGHTATLTITTEVLVSNDNVENYAIVNSTTYDPDLTNNDDEDEIRVKTEDDVGIVKLVSNATAHNGDTVTWTIVVTNYGPNVAEKVVVTDFIPEGLIIVGTPSHSQGHIVTNTTTNRGYWNIGNLEVNQTVTCIVTSLINITDNTIINYVTVTTDSHDPDLTNNEAENRTVVPPEADVQVVKTVSNKTPNKEENVVWTIRIYNAGPNAASNVIVRDVLPAGLEYVSHEPPVKGTFSPTTGIWTVGTLNAQEENYLRITTKVVDTGNITNEVNITTSTYDTNPDNNYDNETINVPAIADLVITKLVSNKTSKFGDVITWTINVTNNGPNNARNVIVDDNLPSGLIYLTHNASKGIYDHVQGIWQVGDLLHFASAQIVITTRVNITNVNITNVAVVTSDTPDNDTTNNKANNTTEVSTLADLAIVKVVDNHSPLKGDNVTWIITVTNNDPDAAVNARVKVVIPEGLIFVNASCDGSYDNDTHIWTIGDMQKDDVRVLRIVTTVNVTKTVITNIANVTSDTPDIDESNNEDNATIDVGHQADLEVIKTVSNRTPKFGETITWNITVINHGPDEAVDVYVNDTLPKGLVWVSDDSNGAYDHEKGIWTIGTLHNGTNVSLIITTLVNITNTTLINVAVVDSDTNDTNESNNRDDDNITVRPLADLEIFKWTSVTTAHYNDEVIWTIYVFNHGPDTAVDAFVNDILPKGLKYINHETATGDYNNDTGIWDIGDMASGSGATLYIYTVVTLTNGNITNIAVANSSTEDPDPENNEDNDTINVTSIADLEIIKVVSNKNPHFGENITWTVTVTNNGPCDAYDVNVTDKLPAGLIYQTDDSNGKYNATTGIWTIGKLENGSSVSLIITTLVNITNANITNVAVVNSTTPDSNESNNKANDTTYVAPEADLEIIKLVSNSTSKYGDEITWTVIVTNKGPDAAKNVYVRDTFPHADLIFNGYSVTKGIYDSNSYTWFIRTLAKGESQNLTIKSIVNVTNKTIKNFVNVTNDVYDPNETNNEANNTTVIDSRANLVVVKVVSNKNPKFGEVITWTITVTNNGPDTSVNTVVNDTLPNGLIFLDSDGDYDNNTGIWNVGDLANGASKSLVITTRVNITNATIRNVANATSDTPGNSTPGNNSTVVDPVANITVVKLVSANVTKTGDVITWTVIVTNNGPDVSVNTRVTDKLPAGLIYNGHHADMGNYDHESGLWIIGDMANGDVKKLVISTIVNITNTTIKNVANVTSDTPGDKTNGTNNTTSSLKLT